MAKTLDAVLMAVLAGAFIAVLIYKLALMFKYRNDREKLQALISSGQVVPRRLRRFIYDEPPDIGRAQDVDTRIK